MSNIRIASDGKPIEITGIPTGLSAKDGVSLSVAQPLMKRDLSRAGTEIYVLPKFKLIYDEDGYCVERRVCQIPYDIVAKLEEMNKDK